MPSRTFEERHGTGSAGVIFDVDGDWEQVRSEFQEITVFENRDFGTVLALDGLVMTTDRDGHFYHEWLVHPAMTAHPDPANVLVIGGGDGGTVTELCRYPQVQSIVHVEIDGQVIDICRRRFPDLSRGLDDPRVETIVGDGAKYVATSDRQFDLVIVDGSDPVGPATVLFSPAFLAACRDRLTDNGIFVTQSESPLYYADTIRTLHNNLQAIHNWSGIYEGVVPTYPGALWSWSWAGPGNQPVTTVRPAPEGLVAWHPGQFPDPERNSALVRALL